MTNEEAIETLKTMYPKKCKMIDGRFVGGYDDYESEKGQAVTLAIKALENKNVIKCETAEKHNKKCLGYQKSEQDDEPIEECEKCLLYDGLRE